MAQHVFMSLLGLLAYYWFAILNFFFYLSLSLYSGEFFRKNTEKDNNQYVLDRERFWNLNKSPIPGFHHCFYKLRNGLKLHYICNKERRPQPGALVILIHGFPDSCVMWRHVLQEPAIPLSRATYVAVDLPGYGGSDSFPKYDTEVLEALTEYIVAMRDTYLETLPSGHTESGTYVVGHDWGCVLAMRLASEAPTLADRFILTNGPHVELCFANRDRIVHSASKIFKQFKKSPRQNFSCLGKTLHTLGPLAFQAVLFGYQFAFHLPAMLVKYLGTGGNFAFLRGAHKASHGEHPAEYHMMEALASTFGPGISQCKPHSDSVTNGATEYYGETVLARAESPSEAFWQMTSYYRDGCGWLPWSKTLETIADLYALDSEASSSDSPARRRSSSSASSGLFNNMVKGAFHAPTTILWGEKDQACTKAVCLDGIGDYLARDSEVTLLPRSGHWTPVEVESRAALARIIGLYATQGDAPIPSVTKYINEVYEGASLMVRK